MLHQLRIVTQLLLLYIYMLSARPKANKMYAMFEIHTSGEYVALAIEPRFHVYLTSVKAHVSIM
jgi:hypothetical protein